MGKTDFLWVRKKVFDVAFANFLLRSLPELRRQEILVMFVENLAQNR